MLEWPYLMLPRKNLSTFYEFDVECSPDNWAHEVLSRWTIRGTPWLVELGDVELSRSSSDILREIPLFVGRLDMTKFWEISDEQVHVCTQHYSR